MPIWFIQMLQPHGQRSHCGCACVLQSNSQARPCPRKAPLLPIPLPHTTPPLGDPSRHTVLGRAARRESWGCLSTPHVITRQHVCDGSSLLQPGIVAKQRCEVIWSSCGASLNGGRAQWGAALAVKEGLPPAANAAAKEGPRGGAGQNEAATGQSA